MADGLCSLLALLDQLLLQVVLHERVAVQVCGTEAGSYLRLIDSCITLLKAAGPSRTNNESK